MHYLVLTDVNGVRTYATCLTYHRSFIAEQVGDATSRLQLWKPDVKDMKLSKAFLRVWEGQRHM